MEVKPLVESTLAKEFRSASGITHPAGSKITFATKFPTKKFGELLLTTPNPVTLNLDFAEKVAEELKCLETDILEKTGKVVFSKLGATQNISAEDAIKNDPRAELVRKHHQLLYDYLEVSMSVVISLVTAIETLVNLLIPHDYVHHGQNKAGEPAEFDKKHVERYFSIEEKIDILISIKNKPDLKKQKFWTNFKELKSLRDNVTHLKSSSKTYVEQYNPIFTSLFDLDADKALEKIVELINYIEPKVLAEK